ncbi:hypothetical protein Pcinc_023369 [Petrolisthes cinctipes]|uniref:Uncharacterized protein n=1 Tax=Petrolisthes cinctipes TaxID=88211 RepID=A0AAE1FBY4_PETCI|nr:hypothetical protein Pcinc_023369 [Petrolisthes cinctipes]
MDGKVEEKKEGGGVERWRRRGKEDGWKGGVEGRRWGGKVEEEKEGGGVDKWREKRGRGRKVEEEKEGEGVERWRRKGKGKGCKGGGGRNEVGQGGRKCLKGWREMDGWMDE